jgi:hypothetical protein
MNGPVPTTFDASGVPARAIDLLDAVERQIGADQAEDAGADLRVEPVLEGIDDVVGIERLAVMPLHTLSQVQRVDVGVLVDVPLPHEIRVDDVVAVDEGQILERLAQDVRRVAERDAARMVPLLEQNPLAVGAAAPRPPGELRAEGAGHVRLPTGSGCLRGAGTECCGEGAGRREAHAEDRRPLQELLPADLVCGVLILDVIEVRTVPGIGSRWLEIRHVSSVYGQAATRGVVY